MMKTRQQHGQTKVLIFMSRNLLPPTRPSSFFHYRYQLSSVDVASSAHGYKGWGLRFAIIAIVVVIIDGDFRRELLHCGTHYHFVGGTGHDW